jgi:hypothetical protein
LVFIVGAALTIAGCNPRADYALVGGAFVPSAHGDIRIEKIDKGQRMLTITMDHLPPPDSIEEGLTDYVVWFSVVGELPVAKGVLDYDSEKRIGVATIPTEMRQFDVQITAERSENPVRPSDLVVTSQRIREKK